MDIVQIVEVEGELGFALPEAVLKRLKLTAGDVVLLNETPQGILLTPASTVEAVPPPIPTSSR